MIIPGLIAILTRNLTYNFTLPQPEQTATASQQLTETLHNAQTNQSPVDDELLYPR